MIDRMSELLPMLISAVGMLAFAVSVIIEVIKNVKFLAAIPTDLVVIVLSIVLSVVATLAYASITELAITWILIVGSVIAGFFVAFIAMYGWEKIATLYDRIKA